MAAIILTSFTWVLLDIKNFYLGLIHFSNGEFGIVFWGQVNEISECEFQIAIPYSLGPEPSCYGSEPVLGSWNVKKGLLLKAESLSWSDQLIWSRGVAVDPIGFGCEYSYYVVDVDNVLRSKIKLVLAEPEWIQDGEVVEFHDLWPVLFLFSSTF